MSFSLSENICVISLINLLVDGTGIEPMQFPGLQPRALPTELPVHENMEVNIWHRHWFL